MRIRQDLNILPKLEQQILIRILGGCTDALHGSVTAQVKHGRAEPPRFDSDISGDVFRQAYRCIAWDVVNKCKTGPESKAESNKQPYQRAHPKLQTPQGSQNAKATQPCPAPLHLPFAFLLK